MKLTFTDPYSDEVENTVSDTFLVIIKNKCTMNELILTESLGILPVQYVTDPESAGYQLSMSDGATLIMPPTYANLTPTLLAGECTITYTLFFWDETTQLWT